MYEVCDIGYDWGRIFLGYSLIVVGKLRNRNCIFILIEQLVFRLIIFLFKVRIQFLFEYLV